MFNMKLFPLILIVLVVSCTHATIQPDPVPTGYLGSTICLHLAAIRCTQPPTCEKVFDSNQGKFAEFHPSCLMKATSISEAEACGSIRCSK